jgi:3-hydroxyacyl-CoA dehydrogenase/enoyl-CoA hydratase/3-hydroxybutyryl-CoA epimerase
MTGQAVRPGVQQGSASKGVVTLRLAAPGRLFPLEQAAGAAGFSGIATSLDEIAALDGACLGVVLLIEGRPPSASDWAPMLATTSRDGQADFRAAETAKALLRRLETLQKPVVACLMGEVHDAAWEVALCAHQRIAHDDPQASFGLRQVSWGLMPGCGGVVRTTRRVGLAAALPLLIEGTTLSARAALEAGLIDALAADADEALAMALAWIAAHVQSEQAWDTKGYRLPGGSLTTPAVAQAVALAPAMLRRRTHGLYPAPEAILAAAVESTQVDMTTALRIESRYFAHLAGAPVTRNLVNLAAQRESVDSGRFRPVGAANPPIASVAIVGAGLMGSGIAYANAAAGIVSHVCDLDLEHAARAHHYARSRRARRAAKVPARAFDAVLEEAFMARISVCAELEALPAVDLAIEAVFEETTLKQQVLARLERQLGCDEPRAATRGALITSNTSTLPIATLTARLAHPEHCCGLHFFSPVERMGLVEIVRSPQSSLQSITRAFDYVRQLGKSAIVVNDARGFFTSRTFGSFVLEGAALLGEGVPAALIENAARAVGLPTGPLALLDETALSLSLHVAREARAAAIAAGEPWSAHPGEQVISRMVEQFGRAGRAAGGGFYEYPGDDKKHLWPGLAAAFAPSGARSGPAPTAEAIGERLLYRQSIEAARCLHEGVLASVAEANVGSVLAIAFPAWTGGVLQWILATGVDAFAARARTLAQQHGERFALGDAALEHLLAVAAAEGRIG